MLTKLARTELRLFLREPLSVFWAAVFPTLLVVVLGSIPSFRKHVPGGGLRLIDFYVPIGLTLTLAMVALQFMPAVLSGYRERGVLRRMSTTPASPAMLLTAQILTGLTVAVASGTLVTAVGRLAFHVGLPRQLVGYAIAFILSAAALFAVGLFIAAIAPSGKAGNAIGAIAFFPVMFFAGLWLPREAMPAALQRISDFTPLGAGEQALHDAATGAWPRLGQLAVLVGYVVVFGLAAARMFRWE